MAGKSSFRFWRTFRGLARLRIDLRRFAVDFARDVRTHLVDPAAAFLRPTGLTSLVKQAVDRPASPLPGQPSPAGLAEKPVIFASYAVDEKWTGSHRYCGGEKSLNNLVLLLRRRGYEAYMVSLDGKNSDWLMQHAPYLSLAEFRERKRTAPSSRCVTSWIAAQAFLGECDKFYFWDHELATTSEYQFPQLERMIHSGRIVRTAAFNRAIQAWYFTIFEKPCTLIRSLVDEQHWQPAEERRISRRVGYMVEDEHTPQLIAYVEGLSREAGLDLEFHAISGVEREVLAGMQTCEAFLVTNVGKSGIWGEGGPLTPHEAMSCGTIPICYDLVGPWEIVQTGFNGFIIPRGKEAAMADALIRLFREPGLLAAMRHNTLQFVNTCHTMETRWPFVAEFLDLNS